MNDAIHVSAAMPPPVSPALSACCVDECGYADNAHLYGPCGGFVDDYLGDVTDYRCEAHAIIDDPEIGAIVCDAKGQQWELEMRGWCKHG